MRTLVLKDLSRNHRYAQLNRRTGVECTFIANHVVPVPKRNSIHSIQVPSGFDIADNEIVKTHREGDLVITSDIPLADEVITKGALALSSRGELFTKETIKARLNIRDFIELSTLKWHPDWWPKHAFSNRPSWIRQPPWSTISGNTLILPFTSRAPKSLFE